MDVEQKTKRELSCAFTGHRPAGLPWGENEADPRCLELKDRLNKALARAYDLGSRHFLCGMARGSDFYFCEAVLALRERYPDVTLEAAVPFPGQSQRWARSDRERYQALLARCDIETLVQQIHTPTCMYRRNRYMVDHAHRLIAVFNGRPKGGGTLNTLNYAMGEGLEIDLIEV